VYLNPLLEDKEKTRSASNAVFRGVYRNHYEVRKMDKKEKRKYDITIDGYKIRKDADFDRLDMTKSERRKKHRKAKLEKKQIP